MVKKRVNAFDVRRGSPDQNITVADADQKEGWTCCDVLRIFIYIFDIISAIWPLFWFSCSLG